MTGQLTAIEQIEGYYNGWRSIANITANGSSTNITTALTTALNTAGKDGVSVPLKLVGAVVAGQLTGVGVVATAPNNRLYVLSNSTQEPIAATGNQVYARLTEASGVYTATYFTLVAGTETAYSFAANTAIDIYFQYRFDVGRLPYDFATLVPAKIAGQDPSVGAGAGEWMEKLTITANNTIPDLTKTPLTGSFAKLFVRGKFEHSLGTTPAFTISGKSIAWNAANAGYSVLTGWDVVAVYPTNE